MNQDIEQTNGSPESNETKRRPWNKRLTPEEIEALPNTQRELSEKEINAAKELYFEHMSAGEIARTMNNMGWTEFETSELVGNHGRGMKGLASGLSWRVQRDEIERAARAEETIAGEPGKSLAPAKAQRRKEGKTFPANERESTQIEEAPAEAQRRKEGKKFSCEWTRKNANRKNRGAASGKFMRATGKAKPFRTARRQAAGSLCSALVF